MSYPLNFGCNTLHCLPRTLRTIIIISMEPGKTEAVYIYGKNQAGQGKAEQIGIFTLYILGFLDHFQFFRLAGNYHIC